MSPPASVVIPVRDGERFLEEVLAAVAAEGPDEVLVIDSGSRDRSVEIARAAGVEVLEIPPQEFGHGRTRNLGAERTSGELICFLTQDATPVPGWLAALREAFELDERVGVAYGPHVPRPDTSPMIGREMTEFFAGFAGDEGPTVQRRGDAEFLSNVNAAYARACWEEIRFRDVEYAEDQAFARDMLEAGWAKVYHPGAGVLHAHDYPPVEFLRRYFDEYRGLRETVGHVEPFAMRSSLRNVREQVAGDRRWMRERGLPAGERARWTARSVVHHGGRRVFSALGSRADRLPGPVRGALSLESRPGAASDGAVRDLPPTQPRPPAWWIDGYETATRVLREGPIPLLDPVPGMADREGLHVAAVIPPFARGSGGHSTLFNLLRQLESFGHTCSVWEYDPLGHDHRGGATLRGDLVEWFGPLGAPVFCGFDEWYGADVALASSWHTVYPVLALDQCRARAYLVQDHEPEFHPTSVESRWAELSYQQGLYCIAASQWLLDLVRERYGADGATFRLGVDHDLYRPRPVARRRDTVVFYARASTPRRAVPLGILALGELHRRRPDTRIVLFGDTDQPFTPFPYEHAGVASPAQLSWLYSEATVGMCLSLTNYSLVPQEMMACGLPCVDLAAGSAESALGSETVELADFDPVALADAIERLLVDEGRWQARSDAGRAAMAEHRWDTAGRELEVGLREALRARERAFSR